MSDDPKSSKELPSLTPEDVAAHYDRLVAEGHIRLPNDPRPLRSRPLRPREQGPLHLLIQLSEVPAREILVLAVSYRIRGERPLRPPPRRVAAPNLVPPDSTYLPAPHDPLDSADPFAAAYIRRRLIESGASRKAIPDGPISELAHQLSNALEVGAAALTDFIAEELDPKIEQWGIKYPISEEELARYRAKKLFGNTTGLKLRYYRVSEDLRDYIEERLCLGGVVKTEAVEMAKAVIKYFENPDRYPSEPANEAQADALIALLMSTRGNFNLAAKPAAPESTPPSWTSRDPNEYPTAESFLRHYFGPRLGIDGDLTQADLSRLDQALFAALRREFKGRLEELHEILPTLKERNDARLMREYGYVPRGEDRKSKLTIMSARPRALMIRNS